MSSSIHSEVPKLLNEISFSGEKDTSKLHRLLTFRLHDKDFDLCISLIRGITSVDEGSPINMSEIELKIYPKEDQQQLDLQGSIFATILQVPGRGGFEIEEMGTINTKVETSDSGEVVKNSGYTPGLVREAITQLLLSGTIEKWNSSSKLTDGGSKMYETLSNDPRLRVIKKTNPRQNDAKFIVIKNDEVKAA